MKIEVEFELGSTVYLKTDPEHLPRMVTGLSVRPIGVLFLLTQGGGPETIHYALEITATKPTATSKAGYR